MIFTGVHIRSVSPDGTIELPHDWEPQDGQFCAFVAPRSHPIAIALHPAAMADILRENLPIASRQIGLTMTMCMLDTVARCLLVPKPLREEASLGTMVVLEGKGAHALIYGRVHSDKENSMG
ncbi:hypothetical protein MCP1_220063 [Candidatus Terasakiella magnetica]|nr:hypothetical protein MCP1_220063 [Candidatus Terasakiella magnetica]